MNTILIRKNIKKLREEYPLTIVQMADRCFMNERNYARVESGESKNLSVELLHTIAVALGVSILDLLPQESINIKNVTQQVRGINNTNVTVNNSHQDVKKTCILLLEQQKQALQLFSESILSMQKQIIDEYINRFNCTKK
jgi:transcriptional regulator with XRE-family HTH domain